MGGIVVVGAGGAEHPPRIGFPSPPTSYSATSAMLQWVPSATAVAVVASRLRQGPRLGESAPALRQFRDFVNGVADAEGGVVRSLYHAPDAAFHEVAVPLVEGNLAKAVRTSLFPEGTICLRPPLPSRISNGAQTGRSSPSLMRAATDMTPPETSLNRASPSSLETSTATQRLLPQEAR